MRSISILFANLIFLVCTDGVIRSAGQSTSDLRINEILVCNDSNYMDDFGRHSPWIEIFNSAYNKVNVGGMYLTDDLTRPTKYLIPKGQPVTSIPSRSYLVFWADSLTTRGILHLNFKPDAGETIALFDSNGKTLIDSMKVPSCLTQDISYGRFSDGAPDKGFLEKTTPNANNNTKPRVTSGEEFEKFDPLGAGMTIIAMGVVFIALALLYLIFKTTGRLMKRDIRKQWIARKEMREKKGMPEYADKETSNGEITGEINAVLALTLYLYSSELHDAENTVLTINKVSRTYSPWSSKIYGLRKLPN
jgi:Na+-transporting methylmalonyl-CoA/oxaloacetate decarboxylase gamma subunit